MKTKLLFAIFIACVSNCYSQNWLWTKSANGSGYDDGNSVSADATGNVFVTGGFGDTITFGSITLTSTSGSSVFIAKYDANGNVLWAKNSTGTSGGGDIGYSVSADAGGNVFVTGWFDSPTITFGSTILTNAGGGFNDVFIAKYDANGNVLWAKSVGGTQIDQGFSVSADFGGNVFVTGFFNSSAITFGSTTLTKTGNANVFIAKYDANGNVLWAKCTAGTLNDVGSSVSADAGGNVFVTGWFSSPTITFGSTTLTNAGSLNLFIAKYDASGNVLWAKSAVGTNQNGGYSASADADGNVFVTGGFMGPTITFGSTILTNSGSLNVFIAKYDASGNVLWAKSAVGTGQDEGYSVSADVAGNVFVTGKFGDTITFGSITLTPPPANCALGCDPMFIVKYDAKGNVLCASALASGGGEPNGLSADPFGNVYIGGAFHVNPFIVGTDTIPLTGQRNVFVAKYTCNNNIAVNELSNEENISVYPNPSSGIFTINLQNKTSDTKICVYDVLGNCVLNKVYGKDASPKINLSNQPKGIYFLEIVSDEKRVVQKIILN